MVGFCISGGIGDAILLSPIICRIRDTFSGVEVAVFDPNIVTIIELIGVKCHLIDSFIHLSADDMVSGTHSFLKSRGCSLAIWNCFRTDHDGFCNHFFALDSSFKELVSEKRFLYYKSLSEVMGKQISPVRRTDYNLEVARFLCSEKDYFADWKRYGFKVSHEDVTLKVPNINNEALEKLSPYCIVHDSKLDFNNVNGSIKAWFPDRWDEISEYLSTKMNVIHFNNKNQKVFKGCIPVVEVLPEKRNFWDYFDFIRKSFLYVGTDSWPGHTAIFLPENKFLILKGAVSYRWDHFLKYSSIIRKGKCQCCEYLSLEKCIFGNGKKCCMEQITVNDVKENIDLFLK